MSVKNLLIPAGIEPATFQFVAQHLNHSAATVPSLDCIVFKFQQIFLFSKTSRIAVGCTWPFIYWVLGTGIFFPGGTVMRA